MIEAKIEKKEAFAVSTLSYSWVYSRASLEQILKKNKELFSNRIDKIIDEVEKKIAHLRQESFFIKNLANLDELVQILKNMKKDFLKSYTLDVVRSPNHTEWVDGRMQEFNETALKFKVFLTNLSLEASDEVDLSCLESLIKAIPEEATKLRVELENLKAHFLKVEEALKSEKVSKQELERLYDSIPNYLTKLRGALSKKIMAMEQDEWGSQRVTSVKVQTKSDRENIEKIKETAKRYHSKLEKIDPSMAQASIVLLEELRESQDLNRVQAIAEEMKYRYLKAKDRYIRGELLKEDILNAYKSLPSSELKELAEQLLKKDRISDQEYVDFMKKLYGAGFSVNMDDVRKKMVALIETELSKYGYMSVNEDLMERLMRGEVVELKTPFGEDYALRMKLEQRTVAIRFVRYVESMESLSEYERHKDVSIGKAWCETYDRLKQILHENGIILEEQYRIEPHERFCYEVRKREAETQTKKHETHGLRRKHVDEG